MTGAASAAGEAASAAGAAVGAGVGEEIAEALEAQAERRGDDGLARDWRAMQVIVETQWQADDERWRADWHGVGVLDQVRGREGVVQRGVGKRLAVDQQHLGAAQQGQQELQHRDVERQRGDGRQP